jgi:hypothetical protein
MKIVSELIACSLSAAVVGVVHLSLHAVVGVIGAEVVDVVPATTTTLSQQQGAIETPYDRILQKENNRIVGGNPVKPGDYPYYVNMYGCGGSLIAPTIVYTAAHCEPKSYINSDVGVGVSSMNSLNNGNFKNGENIRVIKAESHPQYGVGFSDINNDFALLLLEKPYVIESNIKLVLNDEGSVPANGQYLNVIGLGATSESGNQSNKLREVQVPTVSNKDCNSQQYYNGEVTDEMLCAGFPQGTKDSCQGDSGGPLVQVVGSTHYQVGVVSWGEGCAQPKRPGVYSRTSDSIDWVKNIVCDKWNVQGSGLCGDDNDNDNSNNPQPPVPEPTPPSPTPVPPQQPQPTPTPPAPSPSGDCSNQIQIKLKFDFFSEDTSWDIVNKRTQEVVAGNSYFDNKNQATENVDVCDGECYIVTINDGFGDGMCCEWGKGSYKMKLDGKVVAEGGKFGNKVTKEICVGDGGGGGGVGNDNDNNNNDSGTCDFGSSEFKLKFNFDLYSEDISWNMISVPDSKVIASKPEYGLELSQVTENVDVCNYQCYKVTINDYIEDGLCCNYGQGTYSMQLNGGSAFASGDGKSEFSSIEENFCLNKNGQRVDNIDDDGNNGGGDNPLPPIITEDPKFKIEFFFDDYSEDNSFRIKSGSDWFTKNYKYGANETYASETIDLDSGKCYKVYIKDAFKDGMCCKEGDGFYEIAINGEIKFDGDKFGKKATHDFCIDNNGLLETNNNKNNCIDEPGYVYEKKNKACSWFKSKKRCNKKDSDGKKVHTKCKLTCKKC